MAIVVDMRGKIIKGSDGSFCSAYADGKTNAGGALSVSGKISHGQIITITDAKNRFGERNNVKPLYVSLGDQKAGNILGRKTGDYYHQKTTLSTDKPVGSISKSLQFDFKANPEGAIWGIESTFVEDKSRPLLQYIERYYDFDIYQAKYQAGAQFNIKTNRLWGDWGIDPNVCNMYIGYNGSWTSPDFFAIAPEHTPESPQYVNAKFQAMQWLSEEITFQNSSAPDIPDGLMEFRRNNILLNSKTNWITCTSVMPQKLAMIFFDQNSNGSGDGVPNVFEYLGYINLDDEYKRAYVSDSPTRAPGSKLIPMIQTAWAPGSISIQLVNSQLGLAGNYLHIRLDKKTWLEAIKL